MNSVAMKPMDRESAKAIVQWRYEVPYDLYNMSTEDVSELMNGSYYAVFADHDRLIGFFCTGRSAQVPAGHTVGAYPDAGFVDVGFGMRPDLTGRGLGRGFVNAVLAEVGKQREAEKGCTEGQEDCTEVEPGCTEGRKDCSGASHVENHCAKTQYTERLERTLRLTVAEFNTRAVRLYHKLGFCDTTRFTNGERDFLVMERR